MTVSTCTSFLLLLVIHGSLQKSAPSSPTYRAAVVEFDPIFYEFDPERTLNENGATTVSYIEQAAEKNADIVVFPESGLSTFHHYWRNKLIPFSSEIPAPSQRYAACDNNDTLVRKAVRMVACGAKRNKIYVVINLLEVKYCSGNDDCNPDGFSSYITSVVFDRDGIIISRYRKSYLYEEYGFYDYLDPPEIETFTTDFEVTFSHIVCYDINFKNPWINVARKLNVTDFILVTALNAILPFNTPIQVHAAWSYAENINLLAANYNMARLGQSGSGIYAGRDGILTAMMSHGGHEEMLVADVPKKVKRVAHPPTLSSDPEGHVRLVGENQGYQIHNAILRENGSEPRYSIRTTLEPHATKLIAHNGYLFEEISHNGIRCKFEVNVTNLSPPATYRLIAFANPFRDSKMVTLGIRICSIVSCVNETLDSCGLIHNSSTVFESIAVTATYEYSENTTMTPNSLGSDLFPLRSWVFDSRREGDQELTFIFLPKPVQGLLTFGLWGRNFDEDVINSSTSETRTLTIFLGVTILVILLGKRFVYFS